MKFELDEIEKKALHSFLRKHKKCMFTSTIGGKFTYILTPTGLGTLVKVKCNACGKIKDITNTEMW